MHRRILTAISALLLAALLGADPKRTPAPPRLPTPSPPVRRIAVTFDDLPGVSVAGDGTARPLDAMTARLIDAIAASGAPVVGFVNEGKLYAGERLDPKRVETLRRWTDAGYELGNHTRDHVSLHNTDLFAFEDQIARGETVAKELDAEHGRRLRFFRHPYLQTGRDLVTRDAVVAYLAGRGYTVAPVTIDNSEWIFARAYANAAVRNDTELAGRVAAAYVPYMESKLDYYERQSKGLFGREIAQVLLVHANSLNADHFGELAKMMKARSYSFVPLDEALADDAYRTADSYTGAGGITWLHRWALTRDKALVLPNEPRTPAWVMETARVDSE
ncbi:MAG TPA: polysaccharide deacetylase family protein [Thermoanaerobaculia bacterium]|nr:polysaccharide deacetylase family protein [Thermoanaerobaculia bacterium]